MARAGDDRDRGPELLREQRAQRARPRARRARELHPLRRRVPAGLRGIVDHAAAREEHLHPPRGARRAHRRPQGQGDRDRARAHAPVRQGEHPRVVPQLHLVRRHLRRDRGGRGGLLRQAGIRPDAAGGGAAGRDSPVAGALRSHQQPAACEDPAARRAGPDGALRRDHGRAGRGRRRGGAPLQGEPLRHRGAALRPGPGRAGDRAAIRPARALRGGARGRHDARPHPPARGGARRRPLGPHLRGAVRGPQRRPLRAGPGERSDPRLRREPRLLPRRHRGPQRQRRRAELARIDAQAVHLHGRLHERLEHRHGHHRPAPDHPRPGDRRGLRAAQPGRALPRRPPGPRGARELPQHPRRQDHPLRRRPRDRRAPEAGGIHHARQPARLRPRAHPGRRRHHAAGHHVRLQPARHRGPHARPGTPRRARPRDALPGAGRPAAGRRLRRPGSLPVHGGDHEADRAVELRLPDDQHPLRRRQPVPHLRVRRPQPEGPALRAEDRHLGALRRRGCHRRHLGHRLHARARGRRLGGQLRQLAHVQHLQHDDLPGAPGATS